jgi:transposase InsO family protein
MSRDIVDTSGGRGDPMDMARYLVAAVELEGRSVRAVAREHGVSKSWLYELLARHRLEGEAGLRPRSRRPHSSPSKIAAQFEDEIVSLRKELAEAGFDAGPDTIRTHLRRRQKRSVPSVSTIWRVLKARGFVTPEPHKRPKSSYVRFVAALPNELWQMDVTHVELKSRQQVEILNILDDHSRLCVASRCSGVFTSRRVVEIFLAGCRAWGYPAALLSDNGAVFTAAYRGGVGALEARLLSLGIAFKHSRPYHPQTCGKVERFHQTLKRWLERQPEARTLAELQAQLDTFVAYYNEVRPHRAINRRTPVQAFKARVKARPRLAKLDVENYRVRQDRVDNSGKVTLRYHSKLLHIGVGRKHKGKRVILLVAGPKVRVVDADGVLLRELTLDPTKSYQGSRR